MSNHQPQTATNGPSSTGMGGHQNQGAPPSPMSSQNLNQIVRYLNIYHVSAFALPVIYTRSQEFS